MKRLWRYYKQIFSQEYIDQTISGGIKGQVSLLVAVIVGVLVVSSLIVTCLHVGLGGMEGWSEQMWILYNNFVDPGNQFSQDGWSNRFVVVIISLLGSILFGGVLISTISNIIERRVEVVRTGKAYYRSVKNHYVIIGYNDIIASLIRELHKEDAEAVILVMSNQASETVRHNLQAQLNRDEERNVYIYFGNIESMEELRRLNIAKAKEVYILGEQGDYGRDSKNIQCVHLISLLKGKTEAGDELPVYTQFDRLSSYSIIQRFDIIHKMQDKSQSDVSDKETNSNIYFRPFNFHENWARRLWSLYTLEEDSPYESLDYEPICFLPDGNLKNRDKYVHLVIVGFSGMGQALLLEALRVCHYANYDDTQEPESRIRTKITVIDKNMDALKLYFTTQYPDLESQADDIQIVYRNEDVCGSSVQEDLKRWCKEERQLLTIAICISDPDESIMLGLNLPGEIYQNETRVLIRQEIQTDLGKIIHQDNGRYRHVKVFGMLERGISKDMLRDEMPAYINQEYEDLYNVQGIPKEYIKTLYGYMKKNETAQLEKEKARARLTWSNLEENMRWANRYQIDSYLTYLHTLGYKVTRALRRGQQVVTSDEFCEQLKSDKMWVLMRMEKHRWNAERTIEGWRFGEKRDNVHRIHPLLVPFHKVAEEEKLKDKSVIINLPYLIELAGYKIIKP